LPLSRVDVEPPGLGADPEFELPRPSEPPIEVGRDPWNPLFERVFGPVPELPFPIDLPFAIDPVLPLAPWVEKKC